MLLLTVRVIATLCALLFIVGIWTNNHPLTWGAWMTQFLSAEAIGFMVRGTFSGLEWWLRGSGHVGFAVLGAAICAVFGWTLWHFWIEADFAPRLRSTLAEDGWIAGIIFVLSFISSRWRRGQQSK